MLYCTTFSRKINCAFQEKSLFADTARRKGITEDIMALEDDSLEELIESLDLERLVNSIYHSLPDSARDSFLLSRNEGLTNKEIAQIKGLSVKAIEYHMKISLRIFRKKLKDYFSL